MNVVQEIGKFKLYLSREKWAMDEMLFFFRMILLVFLIFISENFPFVEEVLELLFSYSENNIIWILKSFTEMNFQFSKQEKCCL